MFKKKITKIVLLSICFSLLLTGVALATEGGSQPSFDGGERNVKVDVSGELREVPPSDQPVAYPSRSMDNEIFRRQREIESILYGTHKEALANKGINVTHTGSAETYVEIGIIPYNEENAKYIHSLVGKDLIEVVEGFEVSIMPLVAPDNMTREPMIINDEMMLKQMQIDQYIFVDYAEEINARGFSITHTVVVGELIEIGITPFTNEHVEYLISILGEGIIIVEGNQAELFRVTTAEAQSDMAATSTVKKGKVHIYLLAIISAMLIAGAKILKKRLNTVK